MKLAFSLFSLSTQGSLSDFLKRNTVDFESMYRMAHSIACGLVFLHTQRVLDGVSIWLKPTCLMYYFIVKERRLLQADWDCITACLLASEPIR